MDGLALLTDDGLSLKFVISDKGLGLRVPKSLVDATKLLVDATAADAPKLLVAGGIGLLLVDGPGTAGGGICR